MDTSNRQLDILLKCYAQKAPYSPKAIPSSFFPDPITITAAEIQTAFGNFFNVDQLNDGGKGWKIAFWKRVIDLIEEGIQLRKARGEDTDDFAVSDEIVEGFSKIVNDRNPGDGRTQRRYLFRTQDEKACIVIREDEAYISHGTTGLATCVHLSNYLLSNPGSGTGLVSLVAQRIMSDGHPTQRIYATDLNDNVLHRLKENIRQ
ncbi:hypothetical protein BT69DRAFT_1325706, partial [Atractiella rhizophila]